MQILKCVRVVACGKIVQICLRPVHYGQGGPGSEYTWIMRAVSRARGF